MRLVSQPTEAYFGQTAPVDLGEASQENKKWARTEMATPLATPPPSRYVDALLWFHGVHAQLH